MFIDRPRTNTRNIMNLRQLMTWCRGLNETLLKTMKTPYKRALCEVHRMGRLIKDVSLVRHFDVVVGLHGSGLFNAFFMKEGSSVVEVRPTEFNGGWPNQYVRDMCLVDDKDVLLWWVVGGRGEGTAGMCAAGRMLRCSAGGGAGCRPGELPLLRRLRGPLLARPARWPQPLPQTGRRRAAAGGGSTSRPTPAARRA
jgi:hypothetical protein